MIQVIVPTFNSGGYTRACLESLKAQSVPFMAHVVNDASYDQTDEIARSCIGQDERFTYRVNSQNLKSLWNIANTLDNLQADPEDIVCLLDGDDYLTRSDALQIVRETYYGTGCEASFGNYVTCDGETIRTRGITQTEREIGHYRIDGWRYNPLRTFKFKVWRHISQNRYLKMGGQFLPDTGDQALFFCVLELVGGNAAYIEEPLYRVGAVGRSDGASQEVCRQHVISLPIQKRVLDWSGPPAYSLVANKPRAQVRRGRKGG